MFTPVRRAIASLLLAGSVQAASHEIQNETLVVRYDDATATFSVLEKRNAAAFLTLGKLRGASGPTSVRSVSDKVLGRGKEIVVGQANGTHDSLRLFEGLPFVLVRSRIFNAADREIDLTNAIPATFTIDLGKPAAELKVMGTAGLTAPDTNPGSYLFLTCADPASRRGVVAGCLTEDRGSGVLLSSVENGKVRFKAQIDYGHLRLPSGASADLETLAVGVFDDARLGQERFADTIARVYQIKLHPQVAGYCTWYSDPHGGAADEHSIVELAELAARELKPFGFSFVQIDDEWQAGGKFNGPRRGFDRVRPDGPYPHGMKPVADRFGALGLTAGIWFMPFARNYQDPEYKDRQDWFMGRDNGKLYETDWGGTSLDLTQPAVQEHLKQLVRTIHGWGVNYFKMDGLWTGSASEQVYVNDGYREDHLGNNARFHNRLKTNVEVLRDGLKLVRQAAGPEVFFSGCNLSQNMRSLAGTIGLVDSMRIGPDNGQGWRDYRVEITKNESGSIITGPVRGSRLYFLNGRVWWNDPDPCYVRSSISLEHARLITSWVALSGQFNLNSDWLPGLPTERLDILKRCLPSHHAVARPVDYFDSVMPSIWLVTDRSQSVRRDVLGLYNWESRVQSIGGESRKTGLDPNRTYHCFEFWSRRPLPDFHDSFHFELPAESCRVIAVRAAEDHPVLVSTSRHVTQGILDVVDEKWEKGRLSASSQLVANDPCELRIAGLRDGGRRWRLASAELSTADTRAGAQVVPEPPVAGQEDWLRVRVSSPESRKVSWTLEFEGE
jgi:hypothetical protein